MLNWSRFVARGGKGSRGGNSLLAVSRALGSAVPGSVGVALDVDGVLVRGGAVIPGASSALKRLVKHNVPFVFVTNGGGWLESTKAKDLEKKLKIPVSEDMVLVSHTPFRELAKEIGERRVLVLGHEGCLEIARTYGFKRPVCAQQLHAESPSIFPRKVKQPHLSSAEGPENKGKIAAALIIHDPTEWALEMQVLLDLLSEGAEQLPLYACNADLVYNTEHPTPRLTQGAFVEAFRHLFETVTKTPLEVRFCGKPFSITYRLAEKMLAEQADKLKVPRPTCYVGVGDNPCSDIRGARNAGASWSSILVKTGVWTAHLDQVNNDPSDPADYVTSDITGASEIILKELLISHGKR
jgi:HAD superfamily hydrolase (TIGR01456 family)